MKKMLCIQPLWYFAKLDKFYTIYLVLTKNGLEMTFVAGATNLTMIGWFDAGSNLKALII